MQYEFIDEFDLEKLTAVLYRHDLNWGRPTGVGWHFDIYRDKNTNMYVVPNFPKPGKILILDELPEPNTPTELDRVLAQHHSDDKPLKRPVLVSVR